MNVTKDKPSANKTQPIHQEKLLQIFHSWRETEGKISLYGPAMPQAQQVIETFHAFLEKTFKQFPRISIAKKAETVEVVARENASHKDLSHRINASKQSVVNLIDKNIRIPRRDIPFFVTHLIQAKEHELAQRLIHKLQEWYQYSRAVKLAQEQLDKVATNINIEK